MKSLTQILKEGRKNALKKADENRTARYEEPLKLASKKFNENHGALPFFGSVLGVIASFFPIHFIADLILGTIVPSDPLLVCSAAIAIAAGRSFYKFFDRAIDTMLLKRMGVDRTKPSLSEDDLLPSIIIPMTLNEQMNSVREELLGQNSEYARTESANSTRIRETSKLMAEIEVCVSRYRSREEEVPEHLASYLAMTQEAQQNFHGVRKEFEAFRARTEAILSEAERELDAIQPTLREVDLGIRASRLLDQSRQAKTHTEAFLEASVLKLFGKLEMLEHEGRKEIRRRALIAATSIEHSTLQLSLASMDKVLAMAGKNQEQLRLPRSSTP